MVEMIEERYVYSSDMRCRYVFQRRWAVASKPVLDTVVWVLLNPGTGDTDGRRRRTLDRCLSWSRRWGYASLTIVNLFAFRATDPKRLRVAEDPVGPENDETVRRVTAGATRVVVAWGNDGILLGRGGQVARMLREPLCLGVTRRGQPLHPLYVPAGSRLRGYCAIWLAREKPHGVGSVPDGGVRHASRSFSRRHPPRRPPRRRQRAGAAAGLQRLGVSGAGPQLLRCCE